MGDKEKRENTSFVPRSENEENLHHTIDDYVAERAGLKYELSKNQSIIIITCSSRRKG